MLDEFLSTYPGLPLQVVIPKRSHQQLGLIQPRGVSWREAGSPPAPATRPIGLRSARRVARIAVLDQIYPLQPTVPAVKGPLFRNVVLGVFRGFHSDFHPTGVDDQEQQQVDGPVTGIVEFLLLDAARNRPPDRLPFQHLE